MSFRWSEVDFINGLFSWVNLDAIDLARIECYVPTNFYDGLFSAVLSASCILAAVPVTCSIILMVQSLGWRRGWHEKSPKSQRVRKAFIDKAWNLFLMLCFFFFPPVRLAAFHAHSLRVSQLHYLPPVPLPCHIATGLVARLQHPALCGDHAWTGVSVGGPQPSLLELNALGLGDLCSRKRAGVHDWHPILLCNDFTFESPKARAADTAVPGALWVGRRHSKLVSLSFRLACWPLHCSARRRQTARSPPCSGSFLYAKYTDRVWWWEVTPTLELPRPVKFRYLTSRAAYRRDSAC